MNARRVEPAPVAAFLRGLNVGGHRVTMDTLKKEFHAMGFRDARTFIASGNVVFDAAGGDLGELEDRIEKRLLARLGYSVDTFLRTADEVRALAGSDAFADLDRGPDDRVHVIFLKERPARGLDARLREVAPEDDAFAVLERDVLWLRRGKLSDLKLRGSDPVQAASRVPSTMRNLNTLQRMRATFFATT